MDEEKQQSILKKKLPKVVTLNKKAIAGGAIGLSLLLGIIFVNALSDAARGPVAASDSAKKKSAVGDLVVVDKGLFSSLPGSYAQGKKISQILDSDDHKEMMSLKQKLSTVLASQELLQKKLAALTQTKPSKSGLNDVQLTAALKAPIFYSGFAPVKLSQKELDADKALKNGDASNGKLSAYDSQNMQNNKIGFLSDKSSKKVYNSHRLQYPKSRYVLQAGAFLPAILQMNLRSDLPGPVLARVSRDVYDSTGHFVVVPQGSKLIGTYNSKLSYGQSSLQIKFLRLVLPDLRSVVLDNMVALNEKGQSGLSDSINNHTGRLIASAALSAVFTLPQILAQNQMNSGSSACLGPTPPPSCYMPQYSMRSAGLSAIGTTGSQIASALANRTSNLQPTVTVHKGYEFSVFVSKDLVMPPYSAKEARYYEATHS